MSTKEEREKKFTVISVVIHEVRDNVKQDSTLRFAHTRQMVDI